MIYELSNLQKCFSGTVVEPKTTTSIVESLLLSAVRGEDVERAPVWLMRQVRRYKKAGLYLFKHAKLLYFYKLDILVTNWCVLVTVIFVDIFIILDQF